MKRVLLFAAFLALTLPGVLSACDTNLLSLISGNTATDAFVEKSARLVALATRIGQRISAKEEEVRPIIKKLMNAWIEFDNSFSQFPPEWAKKDKNWKTKLRNLADMIGDINANLKTDISKAHNQVLDFSRRLTLLYEHMPKPPIGEKLYNISEKQLEMADAYKEKDAKKFADSLEVLARNCNELRALLDEKAVEHTNLFAEQVAVIQDVYKTDPGKFNLKLKMAVMTADDAYVNMNKQLNNGSNKDKQESK